ncbi:hypothetical protein KAI87_15180, partial [Myxococcota bacterium]|nr:hypothetical protein [Myxococcota bacterium]
DGAATAPFDPTDTAWDSAAESDYSRTLAHIFLRPSVDEEKELWLRFGDRAGNFSDPIAARVLLDRLPPASASVAIAYPVTSGFLNTSTASLTLFVTDENSDGLQMRISNSDGFVGASWMAFMTSLTWFLEPGEGTRTVYVQYQDSAGNLITEGKVEASATVDLSAPVGTIALNSGDSATRLEVLAVELTHPIDTAGYALGDGVLDCGLATYTDISVGDASTSTSYTLPSPLVDGSKSVVVCFIDQAGNTAKSAATIELDQTAPVASIVLNPSDYTQDQLIQVLVTASGATQMCFWSTDLADGSTDSCVANGWVDVAGSQDLNLVMTSEGSKTINAKFKDGVGNEIDAAPQSVILDTVAPVAGNLLLTGTVGASTLDTSWTRVVAVSADVSTFSDADIIEMMVSNDSTFNGALWQDYLTSFTWFLPAGDGQKTVWVKVRDGAGNESIASSYTIGLDQTPPSGGITITGSIRDALQSTTLTGVAAVTLNIAASDNAGGSGSIEMLVSGDMVSGTFPDPWVALSISESVELSAPSPLGGQQKTVAVSFRDLAGNESAVASASIFFDDEAPIPGGTPLLVNNGDIYVNSISATLSLDISGADQMRVS